MTKRQILEIIIPANKISREELLMAIKRELEREEPTDTIYADTTITVDVKKMGPKPPARPKKK